MGAWPGAGYPDDPEGDAVEFKGPGWLCYPHSTAIVNRSPCYGRPCLFESTILTIPDSIVDVTGQSGWEENGVQHLAKNAEGMLGLEEDNRRRLGKEGEERYLKYAAKFAVDGRPETTFRSYDRA